VLEVGGELVFVLTECGVRWGDFALGARRRRTMASLFFEQSEGGYGGSLAVGVSITGLQRKEKFYCVDTWIFGYSILFYSHRTRHRTQATHTQLISS